ncbi:MAG: glycosyltransferase family 39 protein [Chloroflexia bacterium]
MSKTWAEPATSAYGRASGRGGGRPFPWQGLWLFLLVALAAALRCTTLSFQSLWLDEGYTLVEAGRSWGELLLALFDPRQGYPLYILGMKLWSAVWGTGEAALRWPSALAGVCAVPLLHTLGRRLFGRSTGLLAGLLLTLSPLAVWYSQEAKAYAPALLLILAAWLLLWEAGESNRRSLWYTFAGLVLLTLLAHRLLAVLALVGQLAYLLYLAHQGRLGRRYRPLLLGLLLAVLALSIAGLWLTLGQAGATRQFGTERDWSTLLQTFTQFSLRIAPTPPEPALEPDRRAWLLPFAGAALAGMVALALDLAVSGRRRRRAVFLLSSLAVPPAAFFLLYLIRPFYYERYLLEALPSYLLLLAVGMVALGRWSVRLGEGDRPGRVGRWASMALSSARLRRILEQVVSRVGRWASMALSSLLGAVALALSLLPLAASWQQVRDWTLSSRPSKEQFREATLYLQQHLHPGDLLIVHPGYIRPLVELYGNRLPRRPLILTTLREPFSEDYTLRDFYADMDALTRGRRRAWLLLAPSHAASWDPNRWVEEWFTLNPFLHCDGDRHPPCADGPNSGIVFNGITLHCITFNENFRQGFPTPTLPLELTFGRSIRLFGADLEPFRRPLLPGDILPLTLYVQGLEADLPDLETVIRLLGPDGQVWAETAGRPLGGSLPTSCWQPGDEFLDFYELPLPEGLPAGRYSLQVGYRLATERQARLRLPDGSPWAGLAEVEVVSPGGPP